MRQSTRAIDGPSTRRNWLLLLLVLLLACGLASGCGGGNEEEAVEGEESSEEAAAPPPPPLPAARPAAKRPTAQKKPTTSRKGKDTPAAPTMLKKKLPDDRLIDFEFDPASIGREQELESRYPGGRNRRNTFRDIKFSMALRNEADLAIRQAKEVVDQVSNLPEGARNEVVLKKAKENLKKAESSLKSNNYLKAKELAQLAAKLAYDAMRPDEEKEGRADVAQEMKYKGSYQDDAHRVAIITRIDPITRREKLYMKKAGDVLVDPNIVDPNSKQPLSYRVVDIFEDYLVLLDVMKNKRVNLVLNNDYKKEIDNESREKNDAPGGSSASPGRKPAVKADADGGRSRNSSGFSSKGR